MVEFHVTVILFSSIVKKLLQYCDVIIFWFEQLQILGKNGLEKLRQYSQSKNRDWHIALFGENWAETKYTRCIFMEPLFSDERL